MPALADVGRAIQEIRQYRGLSKEGVVEQIPTMTIFDYDQIESCCCPDLSLLLLNKIAEVFNVPVSFISILATVPDSAKYPDLEIALQGLVRKSLQAGK